MEDFALWTRFRDGDDNARQLLLSAQLGLVHFVARQVSRTLAVDVEFDELVSAGTLGLISAAESFDPGRGLAFSTFATPRIRGAILDDLRRQDHVPRSVRRKTRALNSAQEQLGRTLGGRPSDQETAEHLGIDLETVWRWRADIEGAVLLPMDNSDDSAPTPIDALSIESDDSIEDRITLDQEAVALREALLALKPQERLVLSLYYYEEMKLHEIAEVLELTESRISQIRTVALERLRRQLSSLRENVA